MPSSSHFLGFSVPVDLSRAQLLSISCADLLSHCPYIQNLTQEFKLSHNMYPAGAHVVRPRATFARCCCGRSFKPEKDMETYCSQQCARDDTLRALMGEDNAYRQKIQARQKQLLQQKNAGRRYVEKLIPRIFVSAERQLPPTPYGSQFPPTPPPKASTPRQQPLYSTKENAPPRVVPPAPRPNISSPFALQPQDVMRPLDASTSRLQLPAIGSGSYTGPRPARNLNGSSPNARQPRNAASRKEDRSIRRSASESHMKSAIVHITHPQTSELRDPALTYYPQPLRALEIRALPAVLVPSQPSTQPYIHTPCPQVSNGGHLRHSKSFSPYKPFFPANVPVDVNDSLTYRTSEDVWWAVKGLREVGNVDKAELLARQTPRW